MDQDLLDYWCDDGNVYNGDGCDAYCILEYGYECLGGDFDFPDACREVCGDGFNIGINECDDRNFENGDGCDSNCFIENGFFCVGGDPNNRDVCDEICGDGFNNYYFFCDDGNLINGDGCDSLCNIEQNWECILGSPTTRDYCWRPHPHIERMTISPNNTVLTLYFNETVFM